MVNAPILSKLNDKDPRYLQAFERAVAALNQGLVDQKIWNVEINDAKFTISNAVNKALDIICDRYRSNLTGPYRYEQWRGDFSGYCSFNQAAGRIKRLTKNAPKTKFVLDYIEALKEVDAIWQAIQTLKPLIQKGRRPNLNKTDGQRADEISNTGTCAICANRQKLTPETKMVQHGYQMSGYNHSGYRMGKCFGVGYGPYEITNEANTAFKPILANHKKDLTSALETLRSGKIDSVDVKREKWEEGNRTVTYVTYTKADNKIEFDREMGSRIARVESELRTINIDIKTNNAKITGWTLQPLLYGDGKTETRR